MKFIYIYIKIRSSLYSKRGNTIVHFLAHGVFHIFAAIILIIICLLLYKRTTKETGANFKSLELTLEDSHSYSLETFYFAAYCGGYTKKNVGHSSGCYIQCKYTNPSLPTDTINKNIKQYNTSINCPYPFYTKLERKMECTIKTPNAHIVPRTKDIHYDTIYHKITYCESISPKNDFVKINTYYKMYNTDPRPLIQSSFFGDFLGIFENDNNPYFNFSLKIFTNPTTSILDTHLWDDRNGIIFTFDIPDSLGIIRNPIQITSIFPQPTFWSNNEIQYRGKEKIQEVILNRGLFFSGINYNKKAKSERIVFLSTILLGATLAFLLDVIVNLIIKWKKLAEKERNYNKRNYIITMEDDLK